MALLRIHERRSFVSVISITAFLLVSASLIYLPLASASDGVFDPPHTDFGLDTDSDNRYEYLQLDVRVLVIVPGQFSVSALLYDQSGSTLITGDNVTFVAGSGINVAHLSFIGDDIFASGIDGPYRANLTLLNDTFVQIDFDIHLTGSYSYLDFGPVIAFVPPHSDWGVDTDSNGRYNFIQLNVSVNTSLPGYYTIFGILFSDVAMDMKIKLFNLTAGDHVLQLNFSGIGVFISGNNGPYTVWLLASGLLFGGDPDFQHNDTHMTQAYFFTAFESGTLRSLDGVVWNETSDSPVVDEPVWIANKTHRWLMQTQTNATGAFSFTVFEGDFVIMADADGLQAQAVPLSIVGDTNIDINLTKAARNENEIYLQFSDWDNVSLYMEMWGFQSNQSQRFMVDQFVGDGSLNVDRGEALVWLDIFSRSQPPFNDTTGQFEVDGIAYSLVSDTWEMDGNLTGEVISTEPILMWRSGNYTSQSPIPASAGHQIYFRATYDNENETEVLTTTFPAGWVLRDYTAPTNITVRGVNSNTAVVDPLDRPVGEPESVDVLLNISVDTTPPEIENVSATPDPQEVYQNVTISADVTDNAGVAAVSINVTDPLGGTVGNFSMQPGSDTYSYTSSYSMLGQHSFTIWAEDDAGVFNSSAGNFTVQDATPPVIGEPSATPDPQEAGGTVNFKAGVSDNFQVDEVTIDIVAPDASPVGNFSMVLDSGNYTYSDSYTEIGLYSYTIWASDTSGNLASRGGQFTIQDTTPPLITDASATPDPQEVFGTVTIFANATDNSNIASMKVNITDPFSASTGNFTMNSMGGGMYSYGASYDLLGDYTFTIWAKDDAGLVDSWQGSFTMQDTTPPVAGTPSADPNPQEAGLTVLFSVQVTDNYQVDLVTIAITDPSSALLGNFTMVLSGGNYTYSSSFTGLGTYSYTIWASDASGNYVSKSGQFTIQDTLPPQVTGASVSPDPGEVYQDVTITADVWENSGVASVSVRIVDPDGLVVGNFTMEAVDIDTYDYTLALSKLGVYNFTVWVEDDVGLFGSLQGSFTVEDSTDPVIGTPTVTPDPQELGQTVAFSVQVADNYALDSVNILIRDPNDDPVGSFPMTLVSGDYTYSSSFSMVGTYSYRIEAFDTSGNGDLVTGSFVIQDITPPTIGTPTASPDPQEVGLTVTLSVNASDNYQLAAVGVAITDPNDSLVGNFSMTLDSGTWSYSASFDELGTYTYVAWARDTSGNIVTSAGDFVIQDTTSPQAAEVESLTVDAGEEFSLDGSDSTDNHGVANYTWDFGDGTFGYAATLTHVYDEAGEYTVTLTVRDAAGNEDSHSFTVTVLPLQEAGGGIQLDDTMLYGIIAAVAGGAAVAGLLLWRRGGKGKPKKKPPTPPEEPALVEEEEPSLPELEPLEEDEDLLEIEELLKM